MRARRRGKTVHLPLHRQGRQEVLRPHAPQACLGRPRRAHQQAGPGGEAHRPEARRKRRLAKEADADKKREMEAAQAATRHAATRRCSPPTPARRTSRKRAAARCAITRSRWRKSKAASTRSRSARRASRRTSRSTRTRARRAAGAAARKKSPTPRSTSRRSKGLLDAKKKEARTASTRATTRTAALPGSHRASAPLAAAASSAGSR